MPAFLASMGVAAAWLGLIARATAWLGRGVRTPVRKALLAAVTREAYGRAFGFERMMDTSVRLLVPRHRTVAAGSLKSFSLPVTRWLR